MSCVRQNPVTTEQHYTEQSFGLYYTFFKLSVKFKAKKIKIKNNNNKKHK